MYSLEVDRERARERVRPERNPFERLLRQYEYSVDQKGEVAKKSHWPFTG